jgi:RNA polymerase sigma-70 factor (ECF subfamily)
VKEASTITAEIVQAARHGDEAAWAQIYQALQHKVRAVVSSILKFHSFLIDDCTQVVWLKVFRALSTFRGQSNLVTWVCRIARNEALKMRRDSGREERHLIHIDERTTSEELVATESRVGGQVEKVMIAKIDSKPLADALKRLPKDQGKIIRMHLGGLSHAAIGEKMGLNAACTRQKYSRGIRRLRLHFAEAA